METTDGIRHEMTAEIQPKTTTGNDELKDMILSLPLKIRDLRLTRIDTETQVIELERSMKRIESQIITEIKDTLNVAGKPKFSNEQSRKAELVNRLTTDEVSINLQKQIDETKTEARRLDVEIEFESNRFKALRRIVDLVVDRDD